MYKYIDNIKDNNVLMLNYFAIQSMRFPYAFSLKYF